MATILIMIIKALSEALSARRCITCTRPDVGPLENFRQLPLEQLEESRQQSKIWLRANFSTPISRLTSKAQLESNSKSESRPQQVKFRATVPGHKIPSEADRLLLSWEQGGELQEMVCKVDSVKEDSIDLEVVEGRLVIDPSCAYYLQPALEHFLRLRYTTAFAARARLLRHNLLTMEGCIMTVDFVGAAVDQILDWLTTILNYMCHGYYTLGTLSICLILGPLTVHWLSFYALGEADIQELPMVLSGIQLPMNYCSSLLCGKPLPGFFWNKVVDGIKLSEMETSKRGCQLPHRRPKRAPKSLQATQP